MTSGQSTGRNTATFGRRLAKPRDDACDRRAHLDSVVEERKRPADLIRGLANGEPVRERVSERPPRAFRQRLVTERGERLHGAEPPAQAAEQQDAGCFH